MSVLLFGLAILSVIWGVISSIAIANYLSQCGIKINFLLFGIMIIKYVHQYSKITTQENGKPGPWYYSYIISMNAALVLAIIGIILKSI